MRCGGWVAATDDEGGDDNNGFMGFISTDVAGSTPPECTAVGAAADWVVGPGIATRVDAGVSVGSYATDGMMSNAL